MGQIWTRSDRQAVHQPGRWMHMLNLCKHIMTPDHLPLVITPRQLYQTFSPAFALIFTKITTDHFKRLMTHYMYIFMSWMSWNIFLIKWVDDILMICFQYPLLPPWEWYIPKSLILPSWIFFEYSLPIQKKDGPSSVNLVNIRDLTFVLFIWFAIVMFMYLLLSYLISGCVLLFVVVICTSGLPHFCSNPRIPFFHYYVHCTLCNSISMHLLCVEFPAILF